jgi:hypothetical protein
MLDQSNHVGVTFFGRKKSKFGVMQVKKKKSQRAISLWALVHFLNDFENEEIFAFGGHPERRELIALHAKLKADVDNLLNPPPIPDRPQLAAATIGRRLGCWPPGIGAKIPTAMGTLRPRQSSGFARWPLR